MYCCSVALFCCFGTHYMCDPCHRRYNWGIMPLKDCHGVNCPLGIAHPPPHNDPRKGGVFPLGCGICRSEKMEKLQKYQEIRDASFRPENAPKAWIKDPNVPQIIYPVNEIDLPDFIARADELQAEQEELEAQREAERLSYISLAYLPPGKLLKK